MSDQVQDAVAGSVAGRATDVLIVGTGFAGLAAAIKLRQAGFADLLMIEKGDDVGGTWRDNQYPGCACDIPSHLYSLSFAPKADWSRMYPAQPELFAYLRQVADQHDLRRQIHFGVTMQAAAWDDAMLLWRVRTTAGEITARVLISAVGGLHIPALPKLPGVERFQGRQFHSAQWDRSYQFAGRRVAVIGTGASAVQFVPQIAPLVAQLDLYQRTPAWVIPKADPAFSEARKKRFARLPLLRLLFRTYLFRIHELRVLGFLGNKKAMKIASGMALRNINRHIKDETLRRKLTPDYDVGCKRLMISSDYYPALARPNVAVITAGIAAIREHSIIDMAGVERPVDAIVFGTGFEVTSAYRHTPIIGAHGADLRALWDATGMQAYKGISIAGFPNYFMLLGPNTALGHNSVVIMIEAQVRYITRLLKKMRRRGVRAAAVDPAVQARDVAALQNRLRGTVWQDGGCDSWYKDEHGRVSTIWPGSAAAYQKSVRHPDLRDYHLLASHSAESSGTETWAKPPPPPCLPA